MMQELIYPRLLLPAVENNRDRTMVVDGDYRATYAQHLDRVLRLCCVLKNRLGIEPGDRFAVMSLNSHYFLELYHAAYLGAGIINPLNLRLAAPELAYILEDSGTRICFVDAAFAPLVAEIRDQAPLTTVVLLGDSEEPCDARYDELLAEADALLPDEPDETDPVVLMYTGGTTGLPKGVLLNQRAEILNVYHGMQFFQLNAESRFLVQTPMFHAAAMYGLLAVPLIGQLVILPAFEPATVLQAMQQHHITFTVMVPTMIGMVLDHPAFTPAALGSLEGLVYGASPMPQALLARLRELAPQLQLFQGYGMTESSSMLTILTPRDHLEPALLASVGKAATGIVLSIRDENDNELPRGETGEVCAQAGNLMMRYWNKPEATAEAFRSGVYHTGDAGYLDASGYLFLVDRVKDMIISGGENIYSIEVENAIASHPAVAQVAVIGIPDETWGESVHAVVVPRVGESVSEAEIIGHARQSIAGYKVPKSVSFRAEPLPLSGALKVLKRSLREPFWEGLEKSVN